MPWRVFDAEENTFTWQAGDVARYATETEAQRAASALNARHAAQDPAVRLAQLERANRRTTWVQLAIAFVLIPLTVWVVADLTLQIGGGASHIAKLVERLPI